MFQTDLPRRPPHPRAVEMAGAMAQIAAVCGHMTCRRDDLLDEGFTPSELERHGDLARALAARLVRETQPPYAALRLDGWRHKEKLRRQARGAPA